jgi:hypothetical protein
MVMQAQFLIRIFPPVIDENMVFRGTWRGAGSCRIRLVVEAADARSAA